MRAELILSELCSLEIEQETKHFLKASSFQFHKYNDKIYSCNQKLCDAVVYIYLLLNVYSPFSFLASGEEFAQTLEPPLLPLSRLFSAKSAAIREVS